MIASHLGLKSRVLTSTSDLEKYANTQEHWDFLDGLKTHPMFENNLPLRQLSSRSVYLQVWKILIDRINKGLDKREFDEKVAQVIEQLIPPNMSLENRSALLSNPYCSALIWNISPSHLLPKILRIERKWKTTFNNQPHRIFDVTTKPVLLIHGGAGLSSPKNLPQERQEEAISVLKKIVKDCYEMLQSNAPALDVVEAAVNMLEDCPLFNAGYGSVIASDGKCYADASIMDGKTGLAGALCGSTQIKNPISVARKIMERTPHVMLIGEDVHQFAVSEGFELIQNEELLTEYRISQLQRAQKITNSCSITNLWKKENPYNPKKKWERLVR